MKKLVLSLVLIVLSLTIAGCGSQNQVAVVTAVPSPSPMPSPTAVPTEEPTVVPTATPTEEPTSTPRPTPWSPVAPTEPCEPSETRSCSILFVFPRRSYTHWTYRLLGEFERAGYDPVVASKAENVVPPCGAGSQNVEVDIPLTDVNVDDYDAVVIIGGNGCKSQWNDEETHQIIRDAVDHGKVLGAPGCSSTILAHAGVLEGKNATVCTTDAAVKGGLDYNEVLESLGATCGRGIVRDGLIVTAKARSLYFVAGVLETIEMAVQ